MSDKLKRVPLDDEQVDYIAGGKIGFISSKSRGHYVISTDYPDIMIPFEYAKFEQIKAYIRTDCNGLDDLETIAKLQQQGLI